MHILCKHDLDTIKVNESKEARGQFIETGCNTTVLLQTVEETVNKMAFLVLKPVAFPRIDCV